MRRFILTLCLLAALLPSGRAHESPVDHVERQFRIVVKDGALQVTYRVGLTERAALLQLRAMDTDADGHVTDDEAGVFFAAQAKMLAGLFKLDLDGHPLALEPAVAVQRDLQLGQTYLFTAPLGKLTPGRHPCVLVDGYSRMYPGAFRWIRPGEGGPKDIRVEPVVVPEDTGEHPPWIEFRFNIVVPE